MRITTRCHAHEGSKDKPIMLDEEPEREDVGVRPESWPGVSGDRSATSAFAGAGRSATSSFTDATGSRDVSVAAASGAQEDLPAGPDSQHKADVDSLKTGTRVRVWWCALMLRGMGKDTQPQVGWYFGVIRTISKELACLKRSQKSQAYSTVRLKLDYDDGDSREHRYEDIHVEIVNFEINAAALPVEVECGWETLELRCRLSHEKLMRPAKGLDCSHLACCNFEPLEQLIKTSRGSRKSNCPILGCTASIRLGRHIREDEVLGEYLKKIPADAGRVQLRRGESGAYEYRDGCATPPMVVDVQAGSEKSATPPVRKRKTKSDARASKGDDFRWW